MKLLHTADWHLGSPMETRLTAEQASRRRRELSSRFADMIEYAKNAQIDAVLLCGDLSDDGVLSGELQDYLLSLIADAREIRFFLIAGNHDRYTDGTVGGCFSRGRRPMPENLHVFGTAWETVPLGGGVTVSGRSLPSEPVPPQLPALDAGCYNIVLLHGEIADTAGLLGGEGECIPLGALRGQNIDYLALGHEHAFRHDRLDARGTWCYPGCPEGRGFDECGKRGFVILTLDGTHCTGASFVPFARRSLHDLALDVTAVDGGIYAMEQALGVLVRDIPADDLVRVTLTGASDDRSLDTAYLRARLSERFFHAELRDRRVTALQPSAYESDISLRGAFVRAVTAAPMTEEQKSAVLRCGLAALDGQNDASLARGEGGLQ